MSIRRVGLRAFLALALVGTSAATCSAITPNTAASDKQLSEEMLTTLKQFATKHSLNDQQLRRVLDQATTMGVTGINEGGVGVVGHATYVVLDKGSNNLSVRLNKNGRPIRRMQWKGAAQNMPQLVITDGKSVVWNSTTSDLSNWTIVMFTPTEVHYIDVPVWVGGSLARQQ